MVAEIWVKNVGAGQHRLHGPFIYFFGKLTMARLGPAAAGGTGPARPAVPDQRALLGIHFRPTIGHGWNPKTVALWILWAGKIRVGSWSWICCSAF